MVKKLSRKYFAVLVFLLLISVTSALIFFKPFQNQLKTQKPSQADVLGRDYRAPQIYIYGGESNYSSGGMIALASTDEPAVQIGGYNISGTAEIALYEANEDALLGWLIHDKEGKQTKKGLDLSKFQYVTTVKHNINTTSYEGSRVTLPLKEVGIWYLKVKIGSTNADAFVIRSNIGVLTKEGDNEFIFWGQNFKTKRSVTDGNIKILNLQDGKKELQVVSFNAEGIAKANLSADVDIALVEQNSDRAIIPINLKYLNTGYSYQQFQPKGKLTRYFIFTDRPLYKPGDTIYFKAVLRDDDDARYTIPQGEASVKIYSDYYYEGSNVQPIFEKSFPISSDGTINGRYQLPANAKIGYHTLSVSMPNQTSRGNYWSSEWSSNTISFDVQFFKKPEFTIDVTTPKTELIASDKTSFKISGTYFSGQPLMAQKVKYTVYSADFYEYQYLIDQNLIQNISDEYRYRNWYGSNKVTEGVAMLDKNGEAEISLDTKVNFNKGKSQVFSVEATIDDGSLTPAFSRKNILVYAGEYGIYRKDTSYGAKVNTPLTLPVTLIPYRTNTNVGSISLTAKLHRENWISYQEEDKKYPSYKKEEEDLPQITAKTDQGGNATFTFTPTKIGSYTITVEGKDARGNLISKTFYSYVSNEDQPYYTENGSNELTIATDKQKYQLGETVRLKIFSSIPDRDVFLSLERGRINRFQIVRLNGEKAEVEIPLINTDIPNIYAKVVSFSNYTLDSTAVNIPVSAEGKKLKVEISPNSKTFGPGETVTVNVSTTDVGGNPVSADLALWTVDKAIFELSDNKLGDIFKTFWQERGNTTQAAHSLEGILVQQAGGAGGCFAKGTSILMADGKLKNIEDIKPNDYVLTRTEKDVRFVKAKVLNVHKAEVNGYLIINNNLKVTANHIMRVNDKWQEAGSIQAGDMLVGNEGKQIRVESLEWQKGKFGVYNLEVEKYHTYFAGGIWVHNEKGMEREVFKDTAYWNPTLHTDASGRAQVSFKLPDNLTSWIIAAVGVTSDTRVGQTTNEIVVTKDVIVRPILPNILRIGDEIVLSAIVQNFTQQDQSFDIDLKFDSGEVEQPNYSDIALKSNQMQEFNWKVKPTKENDKSKLIFAARSKNNSKLADIVTQEIPVKSFGFMEKKAEAGEGAKTFQIKLASDSNQQKSQITLSLSPTIIGTLPQAMKYLINYPYGCVEQTTSRFVPAVIAKTNQDLFAQALKDKDINDIIEKGLLRLSTLQQGDGGWAWWSSGKSDPFITAYVVEYVLAAKQAGIEVDNDLIKRAQSYLEQSPYEDIISKSYALTLLGSKNRTVRLTNLENLSPDFLSLAVMTNYLNGDKNPQSNGLDKLISKAQTQGDGVFWEAGQKVNFGSKDASTALAIRAIVLAGGDRDLAARAARYLTRVRQSDYWSNTFATAQVVQALVDLSKTGSELAPNYTYTVALDGQQIAQGAVSDSRQAIKDIIIPVSSLKSDGSSVSINKNGDGQIYSTLVINQFHTDRKAPASNSGLSVKREYVNEKGEQYNLAVGDVAIVKITVGGLKANENYGIISDELPAGFVPINPLFKNEQYGGSPDTYYTSYDVTDREVTENGMVLSLYQIAPFERTYTYRARVVSEGSFLVPPATASLMYAPEISGRSAAGKIIITATSKVDPAFVFKQTAQKNLRLIPFYAAVLLIGTSLVIVLIVLRRKKDHPQNI